MRSAGTGRALSAICSAPVRRSMYLVGPGCRSGQGWEERSTCSSRSLDQPEGGCHASGQGRDELGLVPRSAPPLQVLDMTHGPLPLPSSVGRGSPPAVQTATISGMRAPRAPGLFPGAARHLSGEQDVHIHLLVTRHPRLALAGVANGPLNAGRFLAQHVRLQPETNRVLHRLERAFL